MRKPAATRQSDVLQVLKKAEKPLTAYAILGQMKPDKPDLAAPTIYRALAALTEQGRARKLGSLKAVAPCRCTHAAALRVLAFCDDFRKVEEHDGTPLPSELSVKSRRLTLAQRGISLKYVAGAKAVQRDASLYFRKDTSMKIIPILGLALAAASPGFAENTRQLDAHEHGVGQLDIAFDGAQIAMELHAPGADIVGFEYAAESTEDRAAIDAAVAKLAQPLALFVLPTSAECSVVQASARLDSEEGHDDHGHDDHDANQDEDHANHDHDEHEDEDHATHQTKAGHTEFHATYTLNCATPGEVTNIEFAYFDAFPNAVELEIQMISDTGATAFEVERNAPTLDLRGMF